MNLSAPLALIAAGIAAEHSRGESRVKDTAPEHSKLAELAIAMPCGVPALPASVSGFSGKDFLSRNNAQLAALIASKGNLPGVSIPDLDKACALEWARQWLAIFDDAKRQAPKLGQGASRARGDLLAVAFLRNRDSAPTFARKVAQRTALLAAAMDSDLHIAPPDANDISTFLGDAGENFRDGARKAGAGLGDAIAFAIEGVLSPIVGATMGASIGVLASTLGPYVVIGGAIYYLRKKA